MAQLHISIAMCTYNGERFLAEQLGSFLQQTRLPDELVVCDDASQDGTGTILKNFADQAPFMVRLFKNEENLGFAKNFEKAVSLCQGDLIAFSDQDDVWLPEKLACFEEAFQENPDVGCAFSDAAIVDENLQPMGFSLWEQAGFKFLPKYAPKEFTRIFSRRTAILGAVLTFRSTLRDTILPLPQYWVHDEWIPFAASILMGVVFINHKLVIYRQHSSQCCGYRTATILTRMNIAVKLPRDNFKQKAIMWRVARDRLLSDKRFDIDNTIKADLERKIQYFSFRADLPYSRLRRIPLVVREIISGRYHRYSSGLKSALKDLLIR